MDSRSSRNAGSARATALLLTLAGLSLFAAFRVCAIAIADHHARSAPGRALRWVEGHPGALLALARRQLGADQPRAAADTARALLAQSPSAGEGFAVLALAAEREGDAAAALRLMRIAVRRTPRDLSARGWLAENAIRRGDYQEGLEQLDAVMRLSPLHTDLLVPLIAELAADPEFASVLAQRLGEAPRWRAPLMQRLASDADGGAVLARLSPTMDPPERRAWVDRLIAGHAWGQAYAVWAAGVLRPGEALPLVFDPGFDRPGDQGAFGWEVSAAASAADERGDGRGRGFDLHIDQVRPGDTWMSQRLLLPPGRYRFSGGIREQGMLGRGIARPGWQVACMDDGTPLGETSSVDASGPHAMGMDFSVPPGCGAQQLRLVVDPAAVPAQVSLDYRIEPVDLVRLGPPATGDGAVLEAAHGLVLAGRGDGLAPVGSGQRLAGGGRLMLGPGASAELMVAGRCVRKVQGPLLLALPSSCGVDTGPGAAVAAASDMVAGMQLRERIGGLRDPRGAIPAGR